MRAGSGKFDINNVGAEVIDTTDGGRIVGRDDDRFGGCVVRCRARVSGLGIQTRRRPGRTTRCRVLVRQPGCSEATGVMASEIVCLLPLHICM